MIMDLLQNFLIFLLSENEKEICITVELPGVEHKDLKLTIEKDLAIEGVLLTLFDNRLNLCNQVAEEVRDYFKEKVYETVINRNVRLGEAPSFGKPILMYDALCVGSQNYMSLAEEMIKNE